MARAMDDGCMWQSQDRSANSEQYEDSLFTFPSSHSVQNDETPTFARKVTKSYDNPRPLPPLTPLPHDDYVNQSRSKVLWKECINNYFANMPIQSQETCYDINSRTGRTDNNIYRTQHYDSLSDYHSMSSNFDPNASMVHSTWSNEGFQPPTESQNTVSPYKQTKRYNLWDMYLFDDSVKSLIPSDNSNDIANNFAELSLSKNSEGETNSSSSQTNIFHSTPIKSRVIPSTSNYNSSPESSPETYSSQLQRWKLPIIPTLPLQHDKVRFNKLRKHYPMCHFCQKNGESIQIYMGHFLKMKKGKKTVIACPVLRSLECPICKATGDDAHTETYCPVVLQQNSGLRPVPTTLLVKSTQSTSSGQRKERHDSAHY